MIHPGTDALVKGRPLKFRDHIRRRMFPWLVVGVLAVAAVPLGSLARYLTIVEHSDVPPPCYGLGWGCSLSPGDTGFVMGVLWFVAVAVLAGLLAITEIFWRRVAVVRSIFVLLAAVAGLLAWVYLGLTVVIG